MGLNAVPRTFNVSKKSVIDWEDRLGDLKPVLMLCALLHQLIIEGDERLWLYIILATIKLSQRVTPPTRLQNRT